MNVRPLPSQVAIINAVNSPKYRFVCAAVSRRQGKTYIANIIGQLVSLVPGSNILIMSPNYSLSQISFDLQRNLIKHFDLEVTKDNAKDKVIEEMLSMLPYDLLSINKIQKHSLFPRHGVATTGSVSSGNEGTQTSFQSGVQ